MPEITEVTEAVDRLGRAWHEFKEENDKGRQADQEKLTKLNTEIDRLGRQLERVETALNRAPRDGDTSPPSEAQSEHKAAFLHYCRTSEAMVLRELEAKALSVGVDPQGGYLVPEVVSDRIIQTQFDTSPVRQVAMVQPISSDAIEIVTDLNDFDADWVAETQTRADTATPDLGRIRIPVHEIYAKPKSTQQLLEDAAFNIEEWITGRLADKFNRKEATAFVAGNGVGKPRGLLTYDAGTDHTGEQIEQVNSGGAAAVTGDGLISLAYALKPAYRGRAVWLMNRNSTAAVRKLKDNDGQYLWRPGLAEGQPPTLLGYRAVEAEDMPDIAANALPIAFGDLREAYVIADRVNMSILRDPYSSKPYVEFYARKRVGGAVVNFEAVKLQKIAA